MRLGRWIGGEDLLLGLLLSALVSTTGACDGNVPSPDAVASLGEEEITYTELARFVETQTDSSPASLEAAVLSSLLDQYLDERILVHLAMDRGVVDAGGEPSALDSRSALTALLGDEPVPQPTEAELRALYEKRRRAYELPARVRLRQILVEDRETAEIAAAELESGADFSEVARRYSVDPSASTGGVQGELSRADMPEEFAEIIFDLEPDRPSDIVEADYGFHIFMVTERLPERTVPFEEASERLRSRLWEERADARLSELVADARNRYTVRVYEQNLPFDYRGTYPTAPPGDDPDDGSAE